MEIIFTFTPKAIAWIYYYIWGCKPEPDLLTTVPFGFLSRVANQLQKVEKKLSFMSCPFSLFLVFILVYKQTSLRSPKQIF